MPVTALALHVLAYAAAIWGCVAIYGRLRRTSSIQAWLFAIGVLIRITAGGLLFAISKFQLPLLTELQGGDGFWSLAIDARSYFNEASQALINGLGSISSTSASPMYVRALTAWMMIFGETPLSAVSLNLACYVIVVALIAGAAGKSRMAFFGIAAVTFSPALLIFGTQALKDAFTVLHIAVVLTGVRLWSLSFAPDGTRQLLRRLSGVVLLAAGIYAISGVRAYYGLFVVAAFVAHGAVLVARAPGLRWRVCVMHALGAPILWVAFVSGAGAYYPYYQSTVLAILGKPVALVVELEKSRRNFVLTGGNTASATVQGSRISDDGPNEEDAGLAVGTLRGLAMIVIPISMLRATSLVTFAGGQGLLFLTDLDTLMIDVSLLAAAYLLLKSRPRPMPSVMVFGVVLAAVTAVTMGYVVTNYGTLFRLRLLVVAPLWMLAAFAHGPERTTLPARPGQSALR